jgi:hypothetical protein
MIFIGPLALAIHLGFDADWVRFQFQKNAMLQDVANLKSAHDQPVLAVWGWGETGGAGVPNFSYTMIYDESDVIASAPASWSDDFRKRLVRVRDAAGGSNGSSNSVLFGFESDSENISVEKMGDHFYLAGQYIN